MIRKKLEYSTLKAFLVDMEVQGDILVSSDMYTKIDVGRVEVQNYSSGFGTSADIEAGRDFSNISFD